MLSSSECAHLFHKAGARLILCGTTWDKLESLYDSLTTDSDPREVRKLNKDQWYMPESVSLQVLKMNHAPF